MKRKWLRRISLVAWVFCWRTVYLEIFRWHHMTKSLRFARLPPLPGTDITPKAGLPVRAVRVGAFVAPLVFLATLLPAPRPIAFLECASRMVRHGSS